MSNIAYQQEQQRVFFRGDLTRATIDIRFERQTLGLLSSPNIELDLQAVLRIDTAGLAWLLMMVEHANHKSCQLSVLNTPSDLMNLARLSAVDCFLPIDQ